MTSILSSFTALPNLHPALVHFPVALAFTGLALEAFSLLFPSRAWAERAAAALYALAAAGAVAAYVAGRQAVNGLGPIPAAAEGVLSRHADLGLWTMGVLLFAAALRVLSSTRDARWSHSGRPGVLRIGAVAVMLAGAGLVGLTADLGGALVFRHGVAVTTRPADPEVRDKVPTPAAGAAHSRQAGLSRGGDGSLKWRPLAGDRQAMGTVLTPMAGSSAVSVVPASDGGEGLELSADGEAILVLPGTFDDLAAEVRLDPTQFRGAVGLAYHTGQDEAVALFTIRTGGETRLLLRSSSGERTLGTGMVPVKPGILTLRMTVAGSHLKGFVDGRMAVHGHGSTEGSGRVGLFLDGQGTVRIIAMAIRPIAGH